MAGTIETNDTLQITSEQGFPKELNYEKHRKKPFTADDLKGKIFEFKNKPKVRVYQPPPVRNFLVHNIDGKWLYWGLVHVLEVNQNLKDQITSGKFKIIYIYTPDEMKQAHQLIDRNLHTDYFGVMKK
ncbi:MAG: hypothetical protein V1777_00370 [Candidatus Micrarchaeota archaeon]